MPGDAGVLVVTRVLSTNIAHEAAGAAGTRHSPRPPWGREINAQLGRIAPRGRERVSGFNVIARSEATKQSILSFCGKMDCLCARKAGVVLPVRDRCG